MRKGFTLIELIIVVIIIGILAAIGLPQFFRVTERARASEGVAVLGALRGAQIRYAAEHNATTGNENNLDVEFTTEKYFGAHSLTAIATVPNNNQVVAAVTRQGSNAPLGNYVLNITWGGTIDCTGGSSGACGVLGY